MRLFFTFTLIFYATWTHAFTNPIKVYNGSDPQIVYWKGLYYFTSTTWHNIQITAAPTIEGLKTATPRIVWKDDTPNRCCNVWAPEMHRLNGRWYIYYTAGQNVTDYVPTQRTWVLRGGTKNPLSSPYTFVSQITPPNYNSGMIDGTIYTMTNGKTYYIYSSTAGPTNATSASLWIAELLTPSTTGPGTLISRPTFPWEMQGWSINEGPYGLISPGGRDHIVFAASGCNTPHYKLGLLRLNLGADPLNISSWTKFPDPIFTSANGLYGPAHNGFFKSPDGTEDWHAFHANRSPDGGCDDYRQGFVQIVRWNKDDTPNLGEPLAAGTWIDPPSGERRE